MIFPFPILELWAIFTFADSLLRILLSTFVMEGSELSRFVLSVVFVSQSPATYSSTSLTVRFFLRFVMHTLQVCVCLQLRGEVLHDLLTAFLF